MAVIVLWSSELEDSHAHFNKNGDATSLKSLQVRRVLLISSFLSHWQTEPHNSKGRWMSCIASDSRVTFGAQSCSAARARQSVR